MTGLLAEACRNIAGREVTIVKAHAGGEAYDARLTGQQEIDSGAVIASDAAP